MLLFGLVAIFSASDQSVVPPLPPPPPDITARSPAEVLVIDGETISIRTMRVRLFGVSAPDKRQQCESGAGRLLSCGAASKGALETLIVNQRITCKIAGEDRSVELAASAVTSGFVRFVGRCLAGRLDIAQALVDEGFLIAKSPSPYAGSALQACTAAKGLWAYRFEAPWTFKRRRAGVVVAPRMLGQSSGTPCTVLSKPA